MDKPASKDSPLERAIAHAGGVAKLAKRLSTPGPDGQTFTRQRVQNWRGRGLPAKLCRRVSEAVGGAVPVAELLSESEAAEVQHG